MRIVREAPTPTVLLSVSDLTAASSCEFALMRLLDVKLGRIAPGEEPADALMARAARLGDVHEARVLDAYRRDAATPREVAVLARPGPRVADLVASTDATLAALAARVPVLGQGTVFDGILLGHPDFLVLDGDEYIVEDAKLARSAKTAALLQVAAYADMLLARGVPVAPEARLALGSGVRTTHRLADLIPVYRVRRARVEQLVAGRLAEDAAVAWADPRYSACGHCWICEAEIETHRDLHLVAGMRASQRLLLRDAGISTVEQLAASTGEIDGVAAATIDKLREQAALQAGQHARTAAGKALPNGWPIVEHRVVSDTRLRQLPAADAGDVFFDFEGDPLWSADGSDWGLEYLFGLAEADGRFRCWWGHDRAQEKQALVDFMDYITERRAAHPGLHIYHYAPYETSALKRLVGRHGVCEAELDDLLRHGVFVDLLAVVRESLRISQPSYSLKKLEPLYMSERRAEELDNAADSVAMFADATALREVGDVDQAEAVLALIAEYNTYDVRSTLGLRNWLLGLVGRSPDHDPGPDSPDPDAADEVTEPLAPGLRQVSEDLAARVLELAGAMHVDTADEANEARAVRMVAAALGYHWREDKPGWWEYFTRLGSPLDDLRDDRAVFVPDEVQAVDGPLPGWIAPVGKERTWRRALRMTGALPEGTEMSTGWTGEVVYGDPMPEHVVPPVDAVRARGGSATLLDITPLADGRSALTVREKLPRLATIHDAVPEALLRNAHVGADSIVEALVELATRVADHGSADLPQAGLDVLRRCPPRTAVALPAVEPDAVDAITTAVRALDRSYVAVQGPPGTGKTYTGARVVQALVDAGWKVGVVAQSHAVVENMLQGAVDAGLDPARIGKEPKAGSAPRVVPWATKKPEVAALLASDAGALIGGTAWTFTNASKSPRGALDLLVIDEAGQFSLANTLAVSIAADRLLLLGDPQQLPEVSQGTHPEPVDQSALGWLMDGRATMPAELGYFLADTYRMHPRLAAAVSRLSYDDQLESVAEVTTGRSLLGVAPGLHLVAVEHAGNAVLSRPEILEVERLARSVIGTPWTASADAAPTPLRADQVLVVAPYNAQVNAIREHLDAVGLGAVRVGTVDKFQGQEAPVVLVSMTASSPDEVPRGIGFLMNRNRVNVAISRAQWATYLLRSPRLTDYMPATPDSFAELGAFLGLADNAVE